MKEKEFLALKSSEFFDMLEKIARERNSLKVKKRSDNMIVLMCVLLIPASLIRFKTVEKNNNLTVSRTINLLPVILLSIPILAALEAAVYGISVLMGRTGMLTYILIGFAWVLAIIFLIYQTYVEIDEINKKLYRVEV